jgi:hypothetical protein
MEMASFFKPDNVTSDGFRLFSSVSLPLSTLTETDLGPYSGLDFSLNECCG